MVSTLSRAGGRIRIDEINKTDGFTPRVQQLKQRYLDARPVIDSSRGWYWTESWKETEGQHLEIRYAKAFANVFANMPVVIRDGELLVGAQTPFVRGAQVRVESNPTGYLWRLTQQTLSTASRANSAELSPEDKTKLIAACEYWVKYVEKNVPPEVGKLYLDEDLARAMNQGCLRATIGEGGSLTRRGMGTTGIVPGCNWTKLMTIGMGGFIAEAKDHLAHIRSKPRNEFNTEDVDKMANLEGMIIALEGMITFARRHAALAREMAASEKDPQRRKELEKIADVCDWVPANPPRDFQEALQAHWFVLIGHEMEKTFANAYVARFDQYCWPTYEKDIREGRLTRQDAAELMGCMFIKWQSLEAFVTTQFLTWAPASYLPNVTLGGITRDGRDASNELSCLVLHVAKQVHTNQPHISLRWHRAMAPELFDKAIECARDHGAGIPAFFNDRHGIEYLCDRGIPHEEARDWAVAGCINIAVPSGQCWNKQGGAGYLNHAKLLELALNNGVDPKTGVKMGLGTGDPRSFRNFEELLDAYRKQIDYYYEWSLALGEKTARVVEANQAHTPFISALLDDCIQRGKDANYGGERYNHELGGGHTNDRALPDATDSLAVIKKVVFEGGVPMATLLDALKANWVGYDDLLQKCLSVPKYGNDEDEPDALMCYLSKYCIDRAMSYRDPKGRRVSYYRQGAAWAQWAGKGVGAMPNGRKAGTSLADASASPCQGADIKGPTAVLNSVSKIDTMYMEGPLLNMKFAPGPLRGREGRQKFGELVSTFMDRGGYHVQFTIIGRDTLQDAQKHPEKYRSLVVRVAGYSAFWVELTPEIQNEIISRTEHQL